MSTALLEHAVEPLPAAELPSSPVPLFASEEPHRYEFSRAQYYRLAEIGMLKFEQRYELLSGDILEIMGQKQPHNALVMRWLAALAAVFDIKFLLCQLPVVISDSTEFEPDLTVLQRPADDYIHGDNPPAEDARLIVEIAVTSLAYDTTTKALRYAQAGVADYWVQDVTGRRLIVHRLPAPDGYGEIKAFGEDETVSPLAAPAASFRVGDFLP